VVALELRGWSRVADRRQHHRGVAVELDPEREGDHAVERRRGDARLALQFEEPGDRSARIEGQRVVPPELGDRGVELGAGVLLGRSAQAALEQLEVVILDHRSFPSSSNLRAMMLRWISELPP
jgi:hypothetical protein